LVGSSAGITCKGIFSFLPFLPFLDGFTMMAFSGILSFFCSAFCKGYFISTDF